MSKEGKHTPGPWNTELRPNHAPTDRWVITAKTVERVAVVSVRGGAESPEANARLIAAAPDLLEALEEAVGDLETMIQVRGDSIDLTAYRAAIAKAKRKDQ